MYQDWMKDMPIIVKIGNYQVVNGDWYKLGEYKPKQK